MHYENLIYHIKKYFVKVQYIFTTILTTINNLLGHVYQKKQLAQLTIAFWRWKLYISLTSVTLYKTRICGR